MIVTSKLAPLAVEVFVTDGQDSVWGRVPLDLAPTVLVAIGRMADAKASLEKIAEHLHSVEAQGVAP